MRVRTATPTAPCCTPGTVTRSTTHGGFDDDGVTMKSVINVIKSGSP
jgi:hypothetical protein